MTNRKPPRLVPTENLASWFQTRRIPFTRVEPLALGFGEDNVQYRLYPYPAPADDETMGVFCEWHTEDYFDVDSGPHVAIGMRGPVKEDPHRGRGLAIGILANRAFDPADPDSPVPLFRGCPDPPGGPSFFIEDFTVCDGRAPVRDWQLSAGQDLPELRGNCIYRIDIHVSRDLVWAGIWQVKINRTGIAEAARAYHFLGQATGPDSEFSPGFNHAGKGCENVSDRGRGNVFIGTGFSDPHTRSRVENIYFAHWKNQA